MEVSLVFDLVMVCEKRVLFSDAQSKFWGVLLPSALDVHLALPSLLPKTEKQTKMHAFLAGTLKNYTFVELCDWMSHKM